jgi:Domain of unknown function (DUF4124)
MFHENEILWMFFIFFRWCEPATDRRTSAARKQRRLTALSATQGVRPTMSPGNGSSSMHQRWWVAILVAGLGLGPAWAQVVYKWVDAQGATQYTSTPPPAGVPVTVIRPPAAPTAEAASQARAAAQRSIDEAARMAEARQREQALQRAQADRLQRDTALRQQRCAAARSQLEVVQRQGPVLRYDERGQRIYLEDSQRDAEIARLKADVAEQCGPLGPDTALPGRPALPAAMACAAAREALRDLQAPAQRAAPSDIAAATQRVQKACAGL